MRPAISVLPIIVFTTIIASCSKNEEKLSFPLETRLISVESQEAVRVFTKNGEITDPGTIKRFISGTEYFGTTYSSFDKSSMIVFSSDSTATLGISAQLYKVSKTAGRLTLSTELSITDGSGSYATAQILDLYQLWKNAEPLQEIPLGLGKTLYKGKYLIVLYGDYNSFKFPALSYKIKRTASPSGTLWAGSVQSGVAFNEFNPQYLNTLKENDTVAVKQSWLHFKK